MWPRQPTRLPCLRKVVCKPSGDPLNIPLCFCLGPLFPQTNCFANSKLSPLSNFLSLSFPSAFLFRTEFICERHRRRLSDSGCSARWERSFVWVIRPLKSRPGTEPGQATRSSMILHCVHHWRSFETTSTDSWFGIRDTDRHFCRDSKNPFAYRRWTLREKT